MTKYIDRDALIKFANNHIGGIDANDIARFPGADVQEVKHGKWDHLKQSERWQCSVCGVLMDISGTPKENLLYYCPQCGAKMDVEGR